MAAVFLLLFIILGTIGIVVGHKDDDTPGE